METFTKCILSIFSRRTREKRDHIKSSAVYVIEAKIESGIASISVAVIQLSSNMIYHSSIPGKNTFLTQSSKKCVVITGVMWKVLNTFSISPQEVIDVSHVAF
jgi:hypothetical protein